MGAITLLVEGNGSFFIWFSLIGSLDIFTSIYSLLGDIGGGETNKSDKNDQNIDFLNHNSYSKLQPQTSENVDEKKKKKPSSINNIITLYEYDGKSTVQSHYLISNYHCCI